jgi:hypothetical protein
VAAEPQTSTSSVPDACQDAAPAGLDARYEHLRHAVLHDRARAFPLGLGLLIAQGVTAWQRLATHLTATTGADTTTDTTAGPVTRPVVFDQSRRSCQTGPAGQPPGLQPQAVSAQLVHALAGLAVALTGT